MGPYALEGLAPDQLEASALARLLGNHYLESLGVKSKLRQIIAAPGLQTPARLQDYCFLFANHLILSEQPLLLRYSGEDKREEDTYLEQAFSSPSSGPALFHLPLCSDISIHHGSLKVLHLQAISTQLSGNPQLEQQLASCQSPCYRYPQFQLFSCGMITAEADHSRTPLFKPAMNWKQSQKIHHKDTHVTKLLLSFPITLLYLFLSYLRPPHLLPRISLNLLRHPQQ